MEDVILAAVKREFGARAEAVGQACERSASFRSLCRDYFICLKALEHWRESRSDAAPERSAEYSELLAELAREIEAGLQALTR